MAYRIVHSWSKPNSHELYNSVIGNIDYPNIDSALTALSNIERNCNKASRGSSCYWYRDRSGFMFIDSCRTATGDSVNWTTYSLKWVE